MIYVWGGLWLMDWLWFVVDDWFWLLVVGNWLWLLVVFDDDLWLVVDDDWLWLLVVGDGWLWFIGVSLNWFGFNIVFINWLCIISCVPSIMTWTLVFCKPLRSRLIKHSAVHGSSKYCRDKWCFHSFEY